MALGLRKFLPEQYRHRMGINQMVAFDHEACGDTRSRLYVTQVKGGWIFHCHNCAPKMSGFFPNRGIEVQQPPSETLSAIAEIREDKIVEQKDIKLPNDYHTHLPDTAKKWLLKYDITEQDARQFKFGYSPSMDRLILPVYNEKDELIFWQGRNLGVVTKDNPKYLSVSAKGVDKIMEIKHGNQVTIVEDILSAIKVSRYGSAIALLGSYLPDAIYPRLKKYDFINMWLDADKYSESVAYAKRLREFGHEVITICTVKDPKEMEATSIIGLTTK